jgi:hypothetical protein
MRKAAVVCWLAVPRGRAFGMYDKTYIWIGWYFGF